MLEDESNPEDGKGKADDNKAGGNAKKPTSTGGAKAKPQARSTQQWKAAEQRGRRLAIKPHTAMVQGQQGAQMGGRVAYWNPGSQMMQGTTQTMTVNGQQVQVWVPMQAGSYPAAGQQQQQPGAGSAAGVSGAQSAPSAGAGGPQSSAAAGLSTAGAATAAGDGTQAAGRSRDSSSSSSSRRRIRGACRLDPTVSHCR